jgi:hypothetical protein
MCWAGGHVRRCFTRMQTAGLPALLVLGLLTGCYSSRQTDPPRTATEQLLISTAADHAVRDLDTDWIKGKKTFVEEKYFEAYDKGYVISSIRQHLAESGALLMPAADKAEVIVEIRSGALSINTSSMLIGIPTVTIPVPFSGPMQTPEIAFYKKDKENSIGKLALFAYMRETGEHFQAEGPVTGYAHLRLYKAFFVSWKRTDIPQLQGKRKQKDPSGGP